MQGKDGVQGGSPAPARIVQSSYDICHRVEHGLGRHAEQRLQLCLDLFAQPLRLAGAREVRAPRQLVTPLGIGDWTLVHRRVE